MIRKNADKDNGPYVICSNAAFFNADVSVCRGKMLWAIRTQQYNVGAMNMDPYNENRMHFFQFISSGNFWFHIFSNKIDWCKRLKSQFTNTIIYDWKTIAT